MSEAYEALKPMFHQCSGLATCKKCRSKVKKAVDTTFDIYAAIDAEEYKTKLPWPSGSFEHRIVARRKYNEDQQRLEDKFKADLFNHLGISMSHPKAKKLLDMAWDHGHSYGYREVVNFAEQLAELIK